MKTVLLLVVLSAVWIDVRAVSMAGLLGKKVPEKSRKHRKLSVTVKEKQRKLKHNIVKLKAKKSRDSKSKHKKKNSKTAKQPRDEFVSRALREETKPLPSISENIKELNTDLKKIKNEQKREKEAKKQRELELKRQAEQDRARELKIQLDAQIAAKKAKKVTNKKSERRRLLQRFKNLDTPDQIAKLKSIYASYGIKIKDLGNKDLKFLIKNTKKLLKMYYDPTNAIPGFGDRSLGDQSTAAQPSPEEQQQQQNAMAAYAQQQQPDQRSLMAMSPAMMMAKGAGNSIYANRAAGGDMSIKFPDSPPVVVTNQTPFYST